MLQPPATERVAFDFAEENDDPNLVMMSVPDAAKRLGVDTPTLYRWLAAHYFTEKEAFLYKGIRGAWVWNMQKIDELRSLGRWGRSRVYGFHKEWEDKRKEKKRVFSKRIEEMRENPPPDPVQLSYTEVAALCGVSTGTVAHWIRRDFLASMRQDPQTFYRTYDVTELLETAELWKKTRPKRGEGPRVPYIAPDGREFKDRKAYGWALAKEFDERFGVKPREPYKDPNDNRTPEEIALHVKIQKKASHMINKQKGAQKYK